MIDPRVSFDEDLNPFATYDPPPPSINPQPRPNYPPEQSITHTPPPLPERSPDRGDQLMEKMQRMKQENEAKKPQPISETQNQGSTPASRQAFMEEWDRKMAEAQREINEEGDIPKNQTLLTEAKLPITDSAIYPKNTPDSLPKEPTQTQEKISVKIENQPNMMEALSNMDGRTQEKDLMFLGFTPVMVKRSQSEPNETLQKVVDITKEVAKDAAKGLEQAGPAANVALGVGEVIIGTVGAVGSVGSAVTTSGATIPIAATTAAGSVALAADGVNRIAEGLSLSRSSSKSSGCDEKSKSDSANVEQVDREIRKWLKDDYKTITNKSGDKLFISKDGNRKVRFDIENSHGDKPHIHFENKVNGEWVDAADKHRIYLRED